MMQCIGTPRPASQRCVSSPDEGGSGRLGQQLEPVLGGLAHDSAAARACARTRPACSSAPRRAAPISSASHRLAGLVDALEPRDAVEVLGDEHEHVLVPALALRRRAVEVVDPSAAQQRALDRPAVRHALQIALELPAVELWLRQTPPIVPERAAAAQGRRRTVRVLPTGRDVDAVQRRRLDRGARERRLR